MTQWIPFAEPVNENQRNQWALFDSLPSGRIASNWTEAIANVIVVNGMTAVAFQNYIPTATLAHALLRLFTPFRHKNQSQLMQNIAIAEGEYESDFELINPQMLIAAWSTFDAFLLDLVDQRTGDLRLCGQDVPRARLGNSIGAARIEKRLKPVCLNGDDDLTPELRKAIDDCYAIRNVWAHHAGKADEKYLMRCPNSGLEVGAVVKISTEKNRLLLGAIATYGWLIVSRYSIAYLGNPYHRGIFLGGYGDYVAPYFESFLSQLKAGGRVRHTKPLT